MKRPSIRKKLILSYFVISLLLISVGGLAIFYQKKIIKNYDHVVTTNLPNAVLLGDMNQEVSHMIQDLFELSIPGLKPEEQKDLKEKLKISIDNFEKMKAQYEQTTFEVEGEKEVYAPVKENWITIKEYILKNAELASSSDESQRLVFYKNFKDDIGPKVHEFTENLNFVLDFQKAASSENVEGSNLASKQSEYALIIVISIGVLFSLIFGMVFSKNLSNGLLSLADNLSDVVTKILSESNKMLSSSTSLAVSVDAQAAALQETSSSTEELSAMVKRNEDNAEGSKNISENSMSSSIKGREAVIEMKKAISEIDVSNKEILESVLKSNDNITEISNSIKKIGEKTRVINDIVFQTKLLSFNASVEAARAGEQGKGFAVVAEEVGNLATMSGNASTEISTLLESSIQNVESIIAKSKKEIEELVEKSRSKLELGKEASENCQIVLDEVVQNVSMVNDLLSEISNASKEQTIGIEEISKAISLLDSNTSLNNQNAKLTEVTSKELMAEANRLNEIVHKITETVKGDS